MTDAVLEEAKPLAKIHGQPLLELPQDLYIPPDALEVILEAFEGPLDLLLYLIRKHNLDILDIPMADLTRQYMDYVDMIRHTQLDLAADYLVMAAMLTEIKSRMLLPRPVQSAEGEEVADPRAELVRRLLEYEQMKLAAYKLDELPMIGRDYTIVEVWVERSAAKRLPEVNLEDLLSAWQSLASRAKLNKHHRIGREELSVREHMSRILRKLQTEEFAEFINLFNIEAGVPELVVTFLAVLELTREHMIEVTQQAPFAPIYVRLRHGEREPGDNNGDAGIDEGSGADAGTRSDAGAGSESGRDSLHGSAGAE